MTNTFERDHSIAEYWDGPCARVADHEVIPHAFNSVWRSTEDDWDPDRYFLKPIGVEQAGAGGRGLGDLALVR